MKVRIRKLLLIASLLGATTVAAGLLWYGWNHPSLSTDNAYVRSDITLVSAELSGVIQTLHVTDNQRVEKGDLLLEFDPADHRARLAKEQANVARAEAALVHLQSRIALQHSVVSEAEAALRAAQVEQQRSDKDRRRLARLKRQGLASEQLYDQAAATASAAAARVKQQQAGLAATRQQLQVLTSEQQQLEAQLAQARADEQLALLALADTQVRAPVSGVIGNRHVRIGNFTRTGSALLSIVPLDNVWIEANFKETQLETVTPGQPVEIRLDRFPNQPFTGQVLSIAPASGAEFSLLPPDNATGNFIKVVQRVPVKIALQPPAELRGRIIPGMSAEVTLQPAPPVDHGVRRG